MGVMVEFQVRDNRWKIIYFIGVVVCNGDLLHKARNKEMKGGTV